MLTDLRGVQAAVLCALGALCGLCVPVSTGVRCFFWQLFVSLQMQFRQVSDSEVWVQVADPQRTSFGNAVTAQLTLTVSTQQCARSTLSAVANTGVSTLIMLLLQ